MRNDDSRRGRRHADQVGLVPARQLRGRIAELVLADEVALATGCTPVTAPAGGRGVGWRRSPAEQLRLGEVTLLPHQLTAVHRLLGALDEFGGALLADETGLGKTYVALAVAAGAARPLVVAPAALAGMWGEAMHRTGVSAALGSTEALSRQGTTPDGGRSTTGQARHDLLVVDEAQHFRNPRTIRYAALARLARGARVLLLSATPVHNRARDLHALLALFSGSTAVGLHDAALARCIVRRDTSHLSPAVRPPRVRPLHWLDVPATTDEGALLAAILALPPPLPACDGGLAVELTRRGLVRQWSSSVGALRGALRRRIMRAGVLLAHIEAGHHPNASELRRWAIGDDAVQLPLPGLFADDTPPAPSLRATLVRHLDGVRALLHLAAGASDSARADVLRSVRAHHEGHGVVAFSGFADTVHSLHALLARDGQVCALHADVARVAGGTMARSEALRRFAPLAHGAPPPPLAERITLLLTTDVAAEGFNLQDAAAVVHLDIPWTPARMRQRVGRVARLGSPHEEVATYALRPPRGAEALLGLARLHRAKWDATTRTIGRTDGQEMILDHESALATVPGRPAAPPELNELLRTLLRRWLLAPGPAASTPCTGPGDTAPHGQPRRSRPRPPMGHGPLVGAVQVIQGHAPGFLAVVEVDGNRVLLGGRGQPPAASDDPALLLTLAGAAEGAPDTSPLQRPLAEVRRSIGRWWRHQGATRSLAILHPAAARLRRRLLSRVTRIIGSTPLHQRPELMEVAGEVRRALAMPLGAEAERELARLANGPMDPIAWLRKVLDLARSDDRAAAMRRIRAPAWGADQDPTATPCPGEVTPPVILALLLLMPVPDPPGSGSARH